jgi:hypothetical protein
MSVFTHGVNSEGKPRAIYRNQVFPVAKAILTLSRRVVFMRLATPYAHRVLNLPL